MILCVCVCMYTYSDDDDVRPSGSKKTILSSFITGAVGAEMADQADLCLEQSVAVWARNVRLGGRA